MYVAPLTCVVGTRQLQRVIPEPNYSSACINNILPAARAYYLNALCEYLKFSRRSIQPANV